MAHELPTHAPNQEQHRQSTTLETRWAVYSTADLDDSQLKRLEADLNSSGDLAIKGKLAPKCSFYGGSLADVYKFHLWLRDQNTSYHPVWFIVVDSANYKTDGVQIVNLDSGRHGEDNEIDIGRCGVDMACTWLVNFDIANQDWMDLKEEEFTSWDGEDPYPSAADELSAVAPRKFDWYGATNKAAVIAAVLDPEGVNTPRGEHKFTGFGGYGRYSDPLNEIRKVHLRRCKAAKNAFHPTLFVWVDQEELNAQDLVSIVKLHWSGDVDSTSVEEINKGVPEAEVLSKVPASEAWEVLEHIAQRGG